MVKGSTIGLIIGGLAAAGTAAVAIIRPETFRDGDKPKNGTVKIGPDTQSEVVQQGDPFVIVSGGSSDGSTGASDSESDSSTEGTTQSAGAAQGDGSTTPPIGEASGTVDQGSGKAEETAQTEEEATELAVIKGREVRISSITKLPVSAGTPIAEGVEVLVDKESPSTPGKRTSLVLTAAFEALGEKTKATSIRGTPLAQAAISRKAPTLAGVLTTGQGGSRRIRGSPELIAKIEQNLNQTPEEEARLMLLSARLRSNVSDDGEGGRVATGPSSQVLTVQTTPVRREEVDNVPGGSVDTAGRISPLLSIFSKKTTTGLLAARSRRGR